MKKHTMNINALEAFAEIYNPLDFEIKEFGIELENSDGSMKKRYKSIRELNKDNMFGIRFLNYPLKYPVKFQLKAYMDYVNGETGTVESQPVTVVNE